MSSAEPNPSAPPARCPGLVVAGEPVVISHRIYNPAPPPHFASGLSRAEQFVTAAVYSRHHGTATGQQGPAGLADPKRINAFSSR